MELAARVGLSPPPCLRRVQALERGGYIAGYRGVLDQAKLGFERAVFAMVGLKSQAETELKAFEAQARAMAAGARGLCHFGRGGFPAQMRGPGSARLAGLHYRRPHLAANVDSVKTTLILRVSKYEPGVPHRVTDIATGARGGWFSLISSAATAVVVGFASTILLIMEAARAVGATPAQQASLGGGLVFRHGDHHLHSLLALQDADHHRLVDAGRGADRHQCRRRHLCKCAGRLRGGGRADGLAGLIKPLEQAIEKIPAPVAAAMLAGVLLRYALGVPAAALAMPFFVLPLIVALLRAPAVLAAVCGAGDRRRSASPWRRSAELSAGSCCSIGFTALEWTTPRFDGATILCRSACRCSSSPWPRKIFPGFAVLRASGYQPPVQRVLLVTGLGSVAAGALRQPCHQSGGDHRLDRHRPRLPSRSREALAHGLALSRSLWRGGADGGELRRRSSALAARR